MSLAQVNFCVGFCVFDTFCQIDMFLIRKKYLFLAQPLFMKVSWSSSACYPVPVVVVDWVAFCVALFRSTKPVHGAKSDNKTSRKFEIEKNFSHFVKIRSL